MTKIRNIGSVCVSEPCFLSQEKKGPEILNRRKKTELDKTSHFPSFILLLLPGMFSGAVSGFSPPTGRMTQRGAVIMFKDTESVHVLPAQLERWAQDSPNRPLLWSSCAIESLHGL